MGLDRHIMVQYGIFWYRAFQLNFGYSFRYGVPATRLIVERLPNSLRLGAVAAVIGIVVGLPLGVIAALKRGTIIDNLTASVAVFGIVVPQFWLGIMLIIIFSVEFGLLPTSGTGSWKHIIPARRHALDRPNGHRGENGTVIVVEVVFAWPGVGNLMAQAVANRDYPVVFLDVILFGAVTVMTFLIMDLLYAAVDPRIRHR